MVNLDQWIIKAMWHFTHHQRIKQKEIIATIGKWVFIINFVVFLGGLFFLLQDSLPSFIESAVMFSQGMTYLGAILVSLAAFLSWNRYPFWDFIFNQLSLLIVISGYLVLWWNVSNDISFYWGIPILFLGLGLVGLGRRFSSQLSEEGFASFDKSETPTQSNIPKEKLDFLNHPQTIKSTVGAIIWGAFGIGLAIFFRQPLIALVAIILGALIGVDKKQESILQNLKVAFLTAVKFSFLGMIVSAAIGTCFVGLLFGFNTAALYLGAVFGGLIGLLGGAFVGSI